MPRSIILLSVLFFSIAQSQLILYPWSSHDGSFGNAADGSVGFGTTQMISAQCASALNQTVDCDPRMQLLAAANYYTAPNTTGPSPLCDPACNSSLMLYHDSVGTACGTADIFGPYPNSWKGDIIHDYFNLVCATNPGNGEYCPEWLQDQYAANGNPAWINLPDSVLCSSCQLSYMRTMQSSMFLGYSSAMVPLYEAVFNKCSVNFATAPLPPPLASNGLNATVNLTCPSGNLYTVQPGDTCHSIALNKSVSEGTIWSLNNAFSDCSGLYSGETICLPKNCTTYDTTASDDCWSVSLSHNITFPQLLAWNPTISSDCSNLNPNGTVVCISTPDGEYVPAAVSEANSTWAIGVYAQNTVPAPGPIPIGTTTNCGAYYQVQVADTCSRISLAAQVSMDLFQLINPSVGANCNDLIPGLWYCTHPVQNWNVTVNATTTTISSTIPAPAPTPPGTTNECYRWHVVVTGDTCMLLEATLGVTVAELTFWNPNLFANCSNLNLNDAYCVQGPPVPVTTAASMSLVNTPISFSSVSSSSTVSVVISCKETYTVKAGDTCFALWAQFGLTEAQFRALNPVLDANCDISPGQVLCV